ncbi:SagB family peptide dehydrogenase [Streptomyces sp. NPDC017529]|uniref:SagB family peptide dehydrogenase n=1 Tax=Streptomyces sp. NPDC017529 TaxID=3365000 RepID=UPI0037BCFF74
MTEVSDGRAGTLGLRFWYDTFEGVQELFAEGHGSEGGPDDPLPSKTYRGLPRHVLAPPPRRVGDARWSFPGFRDRHPKGPPRRPWDGSTLSALLHHTYGFGRIELGPQSAWPYHRLVASARCFYPVELYVWLNGDTGGVPAGCYHYDPVHHALTALRSGGVPDELRAAVAGAGRDTAALVVLTAYFRKTAFRYRDYAYRLCAQECGMVIGNALLVAGALGLDARVHHRFPDEPVNRALGVDGAEETAFAVLEVGARDAVGARPAPGLPPLVTEHVRTCGEDAARWSRLSALDRAARLTGDARPAPVDAAPFHLPVAGRAVPFAEDVRPPESVELGDALRRRDSGGRMFQPARAPLPERQLADLLRYALEPVPSDHHEAPLPPLLDCHVLALNTTGPAAGLYRLDPSPALVPVPGRDGRRTVAMLCDRTPSVNTARANAVVFLSVDRYEGARRFGDRGYRILHHEAGIAAQRISVLAAAEGLSARITNGYDDRVVRELTGSGGDAHVPVFAIVLGRRQATSQYEPPLDW